MIRFLLLLLTTLVAPVLKGQTSINSGRIRYTSGPVISATNFAGVDIGAQVNTAFASFGAGICGTVSIPSGTYTYTTPIFIPVSCILEGAGRGNETGPFGTKLIYDGAAATVAVTLMKSDMTRSDWASVRDLSIYTNATECPSDGMLKWQTAAAGANKWKCYDGASYTAPTPHLAAILHGQIDPTVLGDGTHITMSNIDVNGGGQNGDNTQQGAFHFGVWLNGCEECLLQSVYVKNADDGFALGQFVNGVVLNQVTARLNRRSGIHIRGFNVIHATLPLLEGNQWYLRTVDAEKYGAGIRFDSEDLTGFGAGRSAGFYTSTIYFEGNDVDVMTPSTFIGGSGAGPLGIAGFSTIRGVYQGATFGGSPFGGCIIANASLVEIRGDVHNNCDITSGAFAFAGNGRLFTQGTVTGATSPQKIRRNTGSSGYMDIFEIAADQAGNPAFLYWRGPDYGYKLILENPFAATAIVNKDSPTLEFKGAKWTGSSTNYRWSLLGMAQFGNGPPESTSGLYLYHGDNLSDNTNRQFAFRESSEFRLLRSGAKIVAGLTGELALTVNAGALTHQADSTIPTRAIVKATGAQSTTNLQEWQNSSGDVLARVSPSGAVGFAGAGVTGASTTTLGAGNLFHIIGNVNIDTIDTCGATEAGRIVTLIFDGTPTVGDASNLKLSGAFATSADDTLTLACDGTNWYEVARSAN